MSEFYQKIHYRIGDHYLCNRACNITEAKCTSETSKVTCKNCLRGIKKGGRDEDDKSRIQTG